MKIFLPWPGYIMNTRNKIYFKLIVIQSGLASYNKMRKFEYFAFFTSFFCKWDIQMNYDLSKSLTICLSINENNI